MTRAIAFLAILLSVSAWAQGSDLGVKLGEKSRLHLGADVGTGFDTNPNYLSMDSDFAGDMTLAVRPRLALDIPGSMLDVEAGARLNYQEYFGIIHPDTAELRQIDGDAFVDLEVNRGGMFGFGIKDNLTRALDPGMAALGARLARTRNDASAGVEIRPGGGLLSFALVYDFGIEIYDRRNDTKGILDTLGLYASDNQIASPEEFDNMEHRLKLRSEWRFLPKTGLFLDIYGGTFQYLSPGSDNIANNPVGIEVGAMGAITAKLSGLAKLGYTNPLIIEGGEVTSAGFIGVVGQAEIRYELTEMNDFVAGIRREARPIYMYKFYTDNRVYAKTKHMFFDRLSLSGELALALLAFDESTGQQTNTTIQGGGNRMDGLAEAKIAGNFYILDWFSVGLSDSFQYRYTNASAGSTSFGYIKNLTLLTLTAYY